MLKTCRSHQVYLKFLQSHLLPQLTSLSGFIMKFVHAMILLDLTNFEPIVKSLYCPDNGVPARDPSLLFRSLILMTLSHETSIDKWCVTMRSFPI